MEKIMKKRPHDFLWRGSQMESKLMPGKEVTQQRTHNSKTFDLGRGAYQTVIYPETVHFKDAEGQWKEIDNRLEEARNEQGEAILRNQSKVQGRTWRRIEPSAKGDLAARKAREVAGACISSR